MIEKEIIITSTIWIKGAPATRLDASQIQHIRVCPDNDVVEIRTPDFTFATHCRMIDVQHADFRTEIIP